ncbi:MAG: DsbA family protein [Chitinophagaceae bacterium]|nr:DsbA family protein [Chitinophagaceae bacterium]
MSQLKPPVNSKDHIQGKATAPLELVEYGDYQCLHCGHAYPIIKNVQRSLGADLKFVFRNFPLAEAHPDAFNAAVAAETAGLQHKFWEMHDIIFENQEALDSESLFLYARSIGLDLERFKNDIQKNTVTEKVEIDFESGVRSGVNGTPSFFINGKKYNGDWEEDVFIQYLKSQLTVI